MAEKEWKEKRRKERKNKPMNPISRTKLHLRIPKQRMIQNMVRSSTVQLNIVQLRRILWLREVGQGQGDSDIFPLFDGKRRLGLGPFGLVVFDDQVGKLFLESIDVAWCWGRGREDDEFVAFESWVLFTFVLEGREFEERHCDGVAVVLVWVLMSVVLLAV